MATLTAPVVGGTGKVELAAEIFGHETHRQLLYEAVRAEMLARRQGTSQTKTRGQVAGGASKPWRQKGTGRARAGTTRSPLWKGGGVVFGPHPREYGVKMNRKACDPDTGRRLWDISTELTGCDLPLTRKLP